AAREGLGVTLIHSDAIEADLESGALRIIPIDGTPLDRPWHAITTRTPTPTTRLFISHILDPAEVGPAAFDPG
ncbi:LysR substrate-binding domain-containing protein, partial [Nocardia aurea]|uniref:LysR substrate-binding domain-containing protein n=1 Tax=Nocardia aurea TaxID=2144174 RepID=UPI0033ACC68D